MSASLNCRRLRGLLKEQGVTQRRFALVADLHETHVSQILTGRKLPGELTLIKIERGLKHLGLTLDPSPGDVLRDEQSDTADH